MYNRDFAHLELGPTPRHDASAGDSRRREKMHNEVNKVEAYLAGMNGNYTTVVDGLRTNPARGRASSNAMPIRTTSHSQHSFDGASRISEGARSTSTRKTTRDGNVAIRFEGSDMFVEGDMGDKILRVTTGEDGNQQITIADAKGRERKYQGEGSRVTTNTSSSRSRSDHDSARPRGDSRSAHDREIELNRRGMKQRSVRYADEPQREYFRPERSFRR
ncbi:hypothetical protein BFW01_g12648 [Lasiodiplodia theobromae]|uniref:Uncharacterized protein n=2 Tax=Lasiodiplodia theobromae TaxID=45133 RepID=A0A5N5DSB6_9PEZI|nr:hypothetical protein DBV05_g1308 [Lasiodiplodia theobromae]KAF9640842.1 hypothetical protein BFW01_g12648 [Lasiodiplodia theobromae]